MDSRPIKKFAHGLQRYTVFVNGFIVDSTGRLPDETDNGYYIELISNTGKIHTVTRAEVLATEFKYKEPGADKLIFIDGDEDNLSLDNLTWDYVVPKKEEVKNAKSKVRRRK
ncbi:hypothetical protein D3C71_448750 [compost metagenome]